MTKAYDPAERAQRRVVLASLAAGTTLAWLVLALEPLPALRHGASTLHPPIDLATFAIAAGLWMTMAVAMMLPPLLPWMLCFAALSRRSDERPILNTHFFVAGYLIVWGLFAIAAAGAQVGLRMGASAVTLDATLGPTVSGGALLLTGAFQLTPFKCGTLTHCRSPMSYLLTHWEAGAGGAIRLGLRHGLYCLGCCWALMVLMLVLGAMSLLWMAGLTVVIAVEKLARHGRRWSLAVGLGLIAWGGWLVVGASLGG